MKVLVSGLVNIETTVKVRKFPIEYYPIDYPFFGIRSQPAGVALNLAKAFSCLGDEAELFSYIGRDEEGAWILRELGRTTNISTNNVLAELEETPASVVLYDEEGRRQIYCDLKDIQERRLDLERQEALSVLEACDMVCACNINFNRTLLKRAKAMGKLVATDVHVLGGVEDDFNREFMEQADILFFSDEQLPCEPQTFLRRMAGRYPCRIFVIGMGKEGAMLYERSEDMIYKLDAAHCGKVVNTVGAGDALFSSFLHFYGKGVPAAEALQRAEVFAAVKIGSNGAAVGFPGEERVDELFAAARPAVHICEE